MLSMARWSLQAGEQPVIKWEEEAFEVLHNRALGTPESGILLVLDTWPAQDSGLLLPRRIVLHSSTSVPMPGQRILARSFGPALRRTGPDPCAGVRIGCGVMSADSWLHNSQLRHNHDMHLEKQSTVCDSNNRPRWDRDTCRQHSECDRFLDRTPVPPHFPSSCRNSDSRAGCRA